SNWWGFGVPKSTPAAIVDKLNSEINAALNDPKIKARLAELGGTALPGSPADFGRLIAGETEKLPKVVKFANMRPGYCPHSRQVRTSKEPGGWLSRCPRWRNPKEKHQGRRNMARKPSTGSRKSDNRVDKATFDWPPQTTGRDGAIDFAAAGNGVQDVPRFAQA